jgi:hypothetical protein
MTRPGRHTDPADPAATSTAAMIGTPVAPPVATAPMAEEPATAPMAIPAATAATPPGVATASPDEHDLPVNEFGATHGVTGSDTATPTLGISSRRGGDSVTPTPAAPTGIEDRSEPGGPSPGAAPDGGEWPVLGARLCWVLTVLLTVVGTVDLGALVLVATSGTANGADGAAAATSLSLAQVLTNIRGWVMGMLASVAVLVWTVAGFRYLWSNGNPEEIAKAKAGFRSGAYGFALAALAPALVEVLKQVCGVS